MQELQCSQCWFSRETYRWHKGQNLRKKDLNQLHIFKNIHRAGKWHLLQKIKCNPNSMQNYRPNLKVAEELYESLLKAFWGWTYGTWFSVTHVLQGLTKILPVPFLARKDYFVGWNIGENTHRRLFSTCLPMFIKCMIIIIYLESLKKLKKKIYSKESTSTKIL